MISNDVDRNLKNNNLDELLDKLDKLYIRSSNYTSEGLSTKEDDSISKTSQYFTFKNDYNERGYNSYTGHLKKTKKTDFKKFFSLNDKCISNDKMKKLEDCIKKRKGDLNLKHRISEKLKKL